MDLTEPEKLFKNNFIKIQELKVSILTDPGTAESQRIEEFVSCHLNGGFFQSTKYFHFIKSVPGMSPFYIIAEDSVGTIDGLILGCLMWNGSGMKAWLSSRCISWGGPLVNENHAARERVIRSILLELVRYTKNR
jgi:hypothetical protein